MEKHYIFKGGLARYWWVPLITGILSIAIGVWCLFSPAESLEVFAYVFAWVITFAGMFNFWFAIANTKRYPGWGWSLGLGLLELICGVWMLSLPMATLTMAFVYGIGFYLIFAVINALCDSCTMFGYSRDWFGWILAILLITLFFAILFMAGPIGGGIAVWLYIGISFIMFGIYRLVLAAKIAKLNREQQNN